MQVCRSHLSCLQHHGTLLPGEQQEGVLPLPRVGGVGTGGAGGGVEGAKLQEEYEVQDE